MMDIASKLTLEIMDLEDKIEQAIEDWQPELIPDYQEELDIASRRLRNIETRWRKPKVRHVHSDVLF